MTDALPQYCDVYHAVEFSNADKIREIVMPKHISDDTGVLSTYVSVFKKLSDIGLVVCLIPNHRAKRKFILMKK